MSETMLNIPRFYTGISECLYALLYIILARKRLSGWRLFGAIGLALCAFIGYQTLAGMAPIYLWIPGMIGAVILMWLFIHVLTDLGWKRALFFTAHAFIIAEFAASLEWQLYYFSLMNLSYAEMLWFEMGVLITVYGSIFAIGFFLEKRYKMRSLMHDLSNNDLLYIVGITVLAFGLGNLNFVDINTPFTGRYPAEIFYIRTLALLLGVILLYAQREHRLATYSKLELTATKNIMERQYDQYRRSQSDRDAINRRYHDLKQHIQLIRAETNPTKKEQHLNAMEKDIKNLRVQYNTGNDVLDTILAAKSAAMHEKSINFTCMANGKLLDFMSVLDLVSIFGNALDNAIEGAEKVEDTNKRLVKLSVYNQNSLLMIRLENYYTGHIKKEAGVILTTKDNRLNHGYGLMSIHSVVHKYGGSVQIKTEDNWFRLYILIPMNPE